MLAALTAAAGASLTSAREQFRVVEFGVDEHVGVGIGAVDRAGCGTSASRGSASIRSSSATSRLRAHPSRARPPTFAVADRPFGRLS